VHFSRDGHAWTSVWADDTGCYEAIGLAPGPWRVTARGDGYAAEVGTLERDATAIEELPIRFEPGCIRGRIVNLRGQPYPHGSVVLRGEHWLNATLNKSGEFALWGLTAGEYAVSAYLGGVGPEMTVEIKPGEIRDLELTADRPRYGTIELDVTMPDGSHPDRLQLFVSNSKFGATSAAPKPIAPGRFPVRMRTGQGRIVIGATPGYGAAEISVEVFENRPRVLAVALPPPGEHLKIDATR